MSRSLSLIDPIALSSALTRAGVRDPSDRDAQTGHASSEAKTTGGGEMPSAFLGTAIASNLAEFHSNLQPRAAPRISRSAESKQVREHTEQPRKHSEETKKKTAPELPAIFLESTSPDSSGTPSRASRLDKRLEGYMEWVEMWTDCTGVFVVDDEGLVLMEKASDPTLVALSAYFLRFQDRIRSLESQIRGSIAIDLEGEHILYVVQADTHLGLHALGFTVSEPLMPSVVQKFQTALPYVFQKNI